MSIGIIFMIAVSLSMDAFSLSLAYGTLNLTLKDIRNISITVALYHFFMPLIGMILGTIILKLLPMNPSWIVFVVLFFIGCQMIIESFKEQEPVKKMTKIEILLFGLAVSIDSLSVGIGLKSMATNYILSASLFALSSLFFTFLGLQLGRKVHQRLGDISTIIGGLVLITLGFIYLV